MRLIMDVGQYQLSIGRLKWVSYSHWRHFPQIKDPVDLAMEPGARRFAPGLVGKSHIYILRPKDLDDIVFRGTVIRYLDMGDMILLKMKPEGMISNG